MPPLPAWVLPPLSWLAALLRESCQDGSSQSLTASSMNNAAGILSYCAQQKLASVTSADNARRRACRRCQPGCCRR
jgi:hypothetical protein